MDNKPTIYASKVNEVFLHLQCDDVVAHEIKDYFSYLVPNHQHMKKFKMGVWDGRASLFRYGVNTLFYGGLTHLKKFCETNQYHLEMDKDVDPQDQEITRETIVDYLKNVIKFHISGKPTDPHEHQIDYTHVALNQKRITIVSPTASGKSSIIYGMIRYAQDNLVSYKNKILLVVNSTNLVEQMYGDFAEYANTQVWPMENVHRVYAGKSKTTNKQIIVTTWQSLMEQPDWLDMVEMLIVDEAHGAKAEQLQKIGQLCVNARYRMGLTGTLDNVQAHKMLIQGLLGPAVKLVSSKDLIDRNILSDLFIRCCVLKHNSETCAKYKQLSFLDDSNNIAKDKMKIYDNEIKLLVTMPERNRFICNLTKSIKGNTLIICKLVELQQKPLFEMLQKLKRENQHVFYVDGKQTKALEVERIRNFVQNNDNCVIVSNYLKFSVGVSIRRLHNIIFASPAKAMIRILQTIGRGLRKSPDKIRLNVFDLADDLVHGKGKKNYGMKHLMDRLSIYVSEEFKYKIDEVVMPVFTKTNAVC